MTDERHKWLEARIVSSLRPKSDDQRNMFLNAENIRAVSDFFNIDDCMALFCTVRPGVRIVLSAEPIFNSVSQQMVVHKSSPMKVTKEKLGWIFVWIVIAERFPCSAMPYKPAMIYLLPTYSLFWLVGG